MALPFLASGAVLTGLATLIKAGVVWAIATFFGRLILSLGIGTITYLGLSELVQNAMSTALSYLDLPSEIMAFAGVLQLDRLLTIWSSALVIKVTMTTLTKVVFKK